jgi:hypothetical protein
VTVHHAMINQSGVLVNTLANLIQQVAGGHLEQQLGPTYFQVCPSAADKGKNPKEEMALPKMPTSDSYTTAAGEWAAIHQSSSNDWLPSSASSTTTRESDASHARGASPADTDATRIRVLATTSFN